MTLRELLEDCAKSLPDVSAETAAGATTWSSKGRPFATLSADGSSVGFALDSAVASAAARTPDALLSSRGHGWVAFRPENLDEGAADRAAAWFASAYRRLGSG